VRNPKNEKILEDFLKDSIHSYSEIIEHFKSKNVAKSTVNDLLKDDVDQNKVFKIDKNGNSFYRVNDFPLDIKVIFAFIDALPQDRFKTLMLSIKNDIIQFYPNLSLEKIVELKKIELEAKSTGNTFGLEMISKFKQQLT
jgi:hypothetical protein